MDKKPKKEEKKILEKKSKMDITFLKDMFTNLKEIGRGTYGIVLSGVSKENGEKYAIKLCKSKTENPKYEGHFDIPYTSLREVVVLKRLTHPNIIR